MSGIAGGSRTTDNAANIPALNFRYVPAGGFQRDDTAENVSVITKGYWLGETAVTQELFEAVMGINPSAFCNAAKSPVERVSWYDAIAFCNKLSLLAGRQPVYSVVGVSDWPALAYSGIPSSGLNADWDAVAADMTKNGYRLPTEMEWMWAAMGADAAVGCAKPFAGSNGTNSIDDYVWYDINSGSKTHEVGKKAANELNLYDMSGNVWEWVWDWYDSYPAGNQTDYTGAASGAYRVLRGGSWFFSEAFASLANRLNDPPTYRLHDIGFRLVRSSE
ncbi:MAG: formylglycine-generating enzyme family protein [Spirochaetaceae bacterium]|jgi:formylglycine-generating enzyme required for sulfatase activity|nr:formylglycine-generating enzyme family protein [Spirochaetaceae bacterium]